MAKRKYNKSASKGSSFEREMCRRFSTWWTGGKREDIFWRTSGSGSRATTRRKKGIADKWNHGDMRPDDPEGFPLCEHYCFEFKFYQKYDLKGVFHHVADKGNWLQWWAKLVDEAASCHRSPVLVTKQTRGLPVIWFHSEEMKALTGVVSVPSNRPLVMMRIVEQSVVISLRDKARKTKTVKLFEHQVYGMLLDDFLTFADPAAMKEWVLR